MHNLRGQFAFRPSAQSSKITVLVGLLEAPAGLIPCEQILTLSGSGLAWAYHGRPMGMSTPHDTWRQFPHCDLGDLLTRDIWNRSSGESDVLQIYTRCAAAPAETPGYDLILFAGLLQSRHAMEDITGFGALSWDLLKAQFNINQVPCKHPDQLAKWTGSTHGHILKLPLWGWSDEPWALRSTMEPNFIADCDRLRHLVLRKRGLGAPLTASEDQDRLRLEQTPARDVTGEYLLDRDPHFFAYLCEKAARRGIDALKTSGRDTLSQILADERDAAEIIAAVLTKA